MSTVEHPLFCARIELAGVSPRPFRNYSVLIWGGAEIRTLPCGSQPHYPPWELHSPFATLSVDAMYDDPACVPGLAISFTTFKHELDLRSCFHDFVIDLTVWPYVRYDLPRKVNLNDQLMLNHRLVDSMLFTTSFLSADCNLLIVQNGLRRESYPINSDYDSIRFPTTGMHVRVSRSVTNSYRGFTSGNRACLLPSCRNPILEEISLLKCTNRGLPRLPLFI